LKQVGYFAIEESSFCNECFPDIVNHGISLRSAKCCQRGYIPRLLTLHLNNDTVLMKLSVYGC